MAKTATCYIGKYTRAMILNLLGGMAFGAILKAIVAFIAFHFIYFKVLSDDHVAWAVSKLYHARLSEKTVAGIFNWVQGFKTVFLTSAYFILVTTAIFLMIPLIAMLFAHYRNKKLIAAGFVNVESNEM